MLSRFAQCVRELHEIASGQYQENTLQRKSRVMALHLLEFILKNESYSYYNADDGTSIAHMLVKVDLVEGLELLASSTNQEYQRLLTVTPVGCETLWQYAVRYRAKKSIKFLLASYADSIGELTKAVLLENKQKARDEYEKMSAFSVEHQEALMCAAYFNNLNMVKLLLKNTAFLYKFDLKAALAASTFGRGKETTFYLLNQIVAMGLFSDLLDQLENPATSSKDSMSKVMAEAFVAGIDEINGLDAKNKARLCLFSIKYLLLLARYDSLLEFGTVFDRALTFIQADINVATALKKYIIYFISSNDAAIDFCQKKHIDLTIFFSKLSSHAYFKTENLYQESEQVTIKARLAASKNVLLAAHFMVGLDIAAHPDWDALNNFRAKYYSIMYAGVYSASIASRHHSDPHENYASTIHFFREAILKLKEIKQQGNNEFYYFYFLKQVKNGFFNFMQSTWMFRHVSAQDVFQLTCDLMEAEGFDDITDNCSLWNYALILFRYRYTNDAHLIINKILQNKINLKSSVIEVKSLGILWVGISIIRMFNINANDLLVTEHTTKDDRDCRRFNSPLRIDKMHDDTLLLERFIGIDGPSQILREMFPLFVVDKSRAFQYSIEKINKLISEFKSNTVADFTVKNNKSLWPIIWAENHLDFLTIFLQWLSRFCHLSDDEINVDLIKAQSIIDFHQITLTKVEMLLQHINASPGFEIHFDKSDQEEEKNKDPDMRNIYYAIKVLSVRKYTKYLLEQHGDNLNSLLKVSKKIKTKKHHLETEKSLILKKEKWHKKRKPMKLSLTDNKNLLDYAETEDDSLTIPIADFIDLVKKPVFSPSSTQKIISKLTTKEPKDKKIYRVITKSRDDKDGASSSTLDNIWAHIVALRFGQARELLQSEEFIKADLATNPSLALANARCYFAENRLKKALEFCQLIKNWHKNISALVFAARCYVAMGKQEEGLNHFRSVNKREDGGAALHAIAYILFEMNDFRGALECYQKVNNKYKVEKCHIELGDFDSALKIFTRLVVVDKSVENYIALAICHEKMSNYSYAIDIYEHMECKDNKTLLSYAQCLKNKGNYEESIQVYHRILSRENSVKALHGLASTYIDQRMFQLAIDTFKSIPQFTQNKRVLISMAYCYERMRHYKEALNVLLGIANHEADRKILLRLVIIYDKLGNIQRSAEYLEKINQLVSYDFDAMYFCCQKLIANEDASALSVIDRAIDLWTRRANFYLLKAEFLSQFGYQVSIDVLSDAIVRFPYDSRLYLAIIQYCMLAQNMLLLDKYVCASRVKFPGYDKLFCQISRILTPLKCELPNDLKNAFNHFGNIADDVLLVGGAVVKLLTQQAFATDFDFVTSAMDEKNASDRGFMRLKHVSEKAFFRQFPEPAVDLMIVEQSDNWILKSARARDFTICALFLTAQGHVLDPTMRGLQDLYDRCLYPVNDIVKQINKDPLVMLRALRYICRGFMPDPCVDEAIREWQDMHMLTPTQWGGIRHKLQKFIEDDGYQFVQLLHDYGLLKKLYHIDYTDNIEKTTDILNEKLRELRLAALKNDSLQEATHSPMLARI